MNNTYLTGCQYSYAVLRSASEVTVDEDIAAAARRLVEEALRRDWKQKVRRLIEATAAKRAVGWHEACDIAEFDIVTSSERIKLESRSESRSEDEAASWEITAQAMLLIIAEIREDGPVPITRI